MKYHNLDRFYVDVSIQFYLNLFISGHESELQPHNQIIYFISELTEETGQDPIVEGVTFYVRYLGSCFVINKTGDEATSEAIKSIVSMVSIFNRYKTIKQKGK